MDTPSLSSYLTSSTPRASFLSSMFNNNIAHTTPATIGRSSMIPKAAPPAMTPVLASAPAATPTAPAKAQFIQRAAGSSPAVTPTAAPTATTVSSGQAGLNNPAPASGVPAAITGDVQTPSGATVNATTGATTADAPFNPLSGYNDAYQAYVNSLNPSPDVKQARDYLNKLMTQSAQDNEKALNSGETLGFAGGEAQRVNHNNQIMVDSASRALSTLEGSQTDASSGAKARVDYAKSLIDATKPFDVNPAQDKYQLNAQTGQYEKKADATAKPSTQITEANGRRVLVDKNTGEVIQDLGLSKIPKAPSASTKGTIRDGSLVYSANDYGEDSKALEQSRGTDGYVDPGVYKNLYDAWTKAGGTTKGFLNKFPSKNYVNPANAWLPPALKPPVKANDLASQIDQLFK